MKTVFKIFGNDVASVSRHFFALAIIVAIGILPALYAWFNIYSNGNPYVNTGNIPIAVASYDTGVTLENGEHVNKTEPIFDDLAESTSIGWQFPDTPEDAIEGVRSGRYYAAIIFEENFSDYMCNYDKALKGEDTPITYYENDKKNAVASKITATAADNLLKKINQEYMRTVVAGVFEGANDISDRIEDSDTVDSAIADLTALRDTLRAYDQALLSFSSDNEDVSDALSRARNNLNSSRRTGRRDAAKAEAKLKEAQKELKSLSGGIRKQLKELEEMESSLTSLLTKIQESGTPEARDKAVKDAQAKSESLLTLLQKLRGMLPEKGTISGTQSLIDMLDTMITQMQTVDDILTKESDSEQKIEGALDTLKLLQKYDLASEYDDMISNLRRIIKVLKPLIASVTDMLDDIDPVLTSADTAVSGLDRSIVQLHVVLGAAADRIDEIISEVDGAADNDKIQKLIEMLGGDPDRYGQFFSSLVQVDVQEVYSVASYGAAMGPFYSILAIWVGGVILVSLLKTNIDRKKYPEATESQAFFGRFLIFFLMGQIQAAVIVLGDIFLLGCDPVHPWMMWFSAAVASFVFVLLIYALSLSFGDIGKAIVVVVMVLQIAGSSGSYPIEILPEIFGKIYVFFPFPYAINAMREALCGTYGHDYAIYLAELLVFGIVGLVIGLIIRKPFIGVNNFVSEKLEETEVL
ncbi:MAG: YhgE/Pip domain-containing protein [Clostridiales bacterium]|nr:YhgE/Pip domain-containing protein [Clostridiales bacterium]